MFFSYFLFIILGLSVQVLYSRFLICLTATKLESFILRMSSLALADNANFYIFVI
jgi:hypothetical protein